MPAVASCYIGAGMGQPTDDAELVRRISAAALHARDAEADLCARLAPRVRLYGLKHLHASDRADDLVQHVLMALLEALRAGRLEDPERLPRFVLGICRNVATRMKAHAARSVDLPVEEVVVGAITPEPLPVSPGRLFGCLEQLDARASTVLRMTYMEERAPEEIAEGMGTTLGNVRVIRHRAIARLQRCLGIEEDVT